MYLPHRYCGKGLAKASPNAVHFDDHAQLMFTQNIKDCDIDEVTMLGSLLPSGNTLHYSFLRARKEMCLLKPVNGTYILVGCAG